MCTSTWGKKKRNCFVPDGHWLEKEVLGVSITVSPSPPCALLLNGGTNLALFWKKLNEIAARRGALLAS